MILYDIREFNTFGVLTHFLIYLDFGILVLILFDLLNFIFWAMIHFNFYLLKIFSKCKIYKEKKS